MARTHKDFIIDNDPRILQLDIAGNPRRWIKPKKVAYYHAKNLISWTVGDTDYIVMGGTSRQTGRPSVLFVNSIVAIKGAGSHIDPSKSPSLSNRSLCRRDHNICAYCGQYFAREHLTRDHVIPTSQGGLNKWSNVVTSCAACNHLKADRTPEQANMPLLYLPYAPSRSEFLLLSNRNADVPQREFLMSKIPHNSHSRILDRKFLDHALIVTPSSLTDNLYFFHERLTSK